LRGSIVLTSLVAHHCRLRLFVVCRFAIFEVKKASKV
jgi:hypothetical protein